MRWCRVPVERAGLENEDTMNTESANTIAKDEPFIFTSPDQPRTKPQLAQFIQRSTRTVDRLMRQGMPYIAVGRPMFHIPTVLAWLLKNQRNTK